MAQVVEYRSKRDSVDGGCYKPTVIADLKEACDWVKKHVPVDARVETEISIRIYEGPRVG